MFSKRGQSTIPGKIVFHEGRQDEVRKMIAERQWKQTEEYRLNRMREKREEKTPSKDAFIKMMDPGIEYRD